MLTLEQIGCFVSRVEVGPGFLGQTSWATQLHHCRYFPLLMLAFLDLTIIKLKTYYEQILLNTYL